MIEIEKKIQLKLHRLESKNKIGEMKEGKTEMKKKDKEEKTTEDKIERMMTGKIEEMMKERFKKMMAGKIEKKRLTQMMIPMKRKQKDHLKGMAPGRHLLQR